MNGEKLPVTVLIVSGVYIVMGAVGFVYHFRELMALQPNAVWIELFRLLAIFCGVFLLRGRNWARWLALAWMAFNGAVSFPALDQVATHFVFLIVIAWLLFQPGAGRYFRASSERA
jgi:hypothetical protein